MMLKLGRRAGGHFMTLIEINLHLITCIFGQRLGYQMVASFYCCSSVTWPKNGSESAGDPALIQTFVLFYC